MLSHFPRTANAVWHTSCAAKTFSPGNFSSGALTAEFRPLEFQVAFQCAFGVSLALTKALAGQAMRYGDKNGHSFVMSRHGNRIMA